LGLRIYDISGRLVRDLSSLVTLPSSLVTWLGDDENGRQVAAGIYFVKLSADGQELVKKAVFLR
jgi:flagellar hook assembly protein FlgD